MPRRATARRWAPALVLLSLLVLGCAAEPGATPESVEFVDEFDRDELDESSWSTCHWWDDGGCTIASNDELQWYLPGQVDIAEGALRLTAEPRPVTAGDSEFPYRSGMVSTGPASDCGPPAYAFTYGSVEARFRVPTGGGLWPAIWMLPADCESRPEIDILEVTGDDPGELIMHLHPEDRSLDSLGSRFRSPRGSMAEGWHDIRLEWSAGSLEWYLDDVRVWSVVGSTVPAEPMYLVANLAVGGAYGGDVADDTRFPAVFEIDAIRITPEDAQ
jgi:beta-glucanase (GH16 family)